MKIKVYDYMTTHYDDYTAIPEPIKEKLLKYNVVILHDNEQKRYTAALCDNKALMKYLGTKRYTIITCLSPRDFVKELDARKSNIRNGLLTADYSSLDTCDSAWLVAYELLRLKILRLAGERV